jgi:hypothetical protein
MAGVLSPESLRWSILDDIRDGRRFFQNPQGINPDSKRNTGNTSVKPGDSESRADELREQITLRILNCGSLQSAKGIAQKVFTLPRCAQSCEDENCPVA